jgi:hypothetical protein
MDTLSKIFDIATEEGHLTPLKGRQARLRLSLYADDVMIFTNPVKEDISCIMQIIKAFGDATGLDINMAKSSIATIRCAGINMDEVLSDFLGQRTSFPIQYLGLPVTLWQDKAGAPAIYTGQGQGQVSGLAGQAG